MRIELPEQKKWVFELDMPIRWGDMDAMGHVNNTVYFRYMESTRIEWFRSIGCEPDPRGEGPVIVNAFCNFYRQLECPGDIRVKLYASNPARATFDTWATIERLDQPGEVHAAGGGTVIWVDFQAQQSRTLPEWLRQRVA